MTADLEDLLVVFGTGSHAVLAANTALWGWTEIALLTQVDAVALREAIAAAPPFDPGLSLG